jgi:hypothetical protein
VSQNNNPIPDITGDANIIAFAQKVLQEVEEGNLDSNWDLEQVCKKVGEHSQMHTYTNYLLMDQDLQQEEWEWCAPGNDFHEDLIDFLDFVTKSGPKPASNSVNTEGGIPGDAMTMTGAHNVEPEVTQSAAASVTENDPNPDAEKDKADDETNAETKDPGPISEKHSETVEPKTKTNDPNVEKKNSACDGETEVVTKTKDAEKTNSDGGDGETVEVVPDKTLELATKDPPANAEKNNGETETMAELVTSDKCKDSNTSLNTADAEAMDEDAEESEESEMFENSDPEAVTETKPKDKEKYKNTTAAASAKSKESKAKQRKPQRPRPKVRQRHQPKVQQQPRKNPQQQQQLQRQSRQQRTSPPPRLMLGSLVVRSLRICRRTRTLGFWGVREPSLMCRSSLTLGLGADRHVTYQYNEYGMLIQADSDSDSYLYPY